MSNDILRKATTGETGNPGEFGKHEHGEPEASLPQLSVLPSAPAVRQYRVTKDSVRTETTGALYTPTFVGTDEMVPQAWELLEAAVGAGELDDRLTYTVGAGNSGQWMKQNLTITAAVPRELRLEYIDDKGHTGLYADTEAALSRIATAWQQKVSEPWSYAQYNYWEDIRFVLADDVSGEPTAAK